ncbi:hypothetical protein Poly51_45840 [Rubripirellula tenax]|uniref:DUF304 domain-containing protein n=1 Tax=Rubripirellula tenax TaxID=2528015 RepID=A0A5C6EFX5_9BACT|nr:hypothetical protein [Rubripirellula tenax]TWU48683.1 hypothetical protein Poly51_45840 [Rubripirellula tenax]
MLVPADRHRAAHSIVTVLNPYEPPADEAPLDPQGDEAESVVIKVAPLYLDGFDLVAGQLPGLIYLWIPAGLVGWLTSSFLFSLATVALVCGLIFLFTIRSLEISSAGLRFRRLFGHPRFLPWNRIVRITQATRQEVLIHGWTAPRFPPREVTTASTTKGHFRIEWNEGWLYFPPADPARFRQLVALHHGNEEPSGPATSALREPLK